MKIEISKHFAKAIHSVREDILYRAIGTPFMKADYLECGSFDVKKFKDILRYLFDEWDLEVVMQREMLSRPNLVTGMVRMFICDRNGVEQQIENLDEIMLINCTTMSTFYASVDEQPPESDCMLSITITPQNERLVECIKSIYPDASHGIRSL